MFGKRTDLAVEAHEICKIEQKTENIEGVKVNEKN